jgi:hypothetical protein
LVGLLVGRPPQNKKVLFGTRTESLLDLIRQESLADERD